MAESNSFEIVIRNETQDSGETEVGGAGGINAAGGEPAATTGSSGSTGKNKVGRAFLSVYKPVKSTVNQIVSYEVSQVELRMGSREQHQKASFAYSMISQGWNTVETVALGAAFGGLAGAAVGLALSAVSTVISISQAQNTLNTQRQLEDVSRNLSAQRVTVSGGRYMNASEF